MTQLPVEAIFFWRYTKAPFASTYGRLPGTEYSKDFLQSPAEQFPLIDRALGWAGKQVDLEFRWPTGKRPGFWRHSAADERGQLAWPTSDAPDPWRLGDPSTQVWASFEGDRTATTEAAANAEFAKLDSAGLKPWIVAVKLKGEERVLHARAYFELPPPGLESRTVERLPTALQTEMARVPARGGGGGLLFESSFELRAPALTHRVLESLGRDPNVLLVGPPGTGKTVVLEDLRALFELEQGAILFDPDEWYDNWGAVRPIAKDRRVVSLVFHPSYSYEDFVAGLFPSSSVTGIKLTARPGPLLSLAHWAAGSKDRRALLIIDEFNRGPAASIFGDTLALLDGTKRHGTRPGSSIQRPFPRDEMEVDAKFSGVGGSTKLEAELQLPENLWIVGALNSTDRSVAPLDAALRRRFSIINVPPDYHVLAQRLGVALPDFDSPFSPAGGEGDPGSWTVAEVAELAVRLLNSLNARIEFLSGADFALGHALLWEARSDDRARAAHDLAMAFDHRIAATLRLTYMDQDDALAALLNVRNVSGANTVAIWHPAPPHMAGVAPRKLVLQELSLLPPEQALSALLTLL